MSDRRNRKKEQTRHAILEASRVLLVKNGLAATTMGAVAEAADIATGTLYNYFPSKDALLVGLWSTAAEALLGQAEFRIADAGPNAAAQCAALLGLYTEAAAIFERPLSREVFAATLSVPPEQISDYTSIDAQLLTFLGMHLGQWQQEGAVAAGAALEDATMLLYGIAMNQLMTYLYVDEISLDDVKQSTRRLVDLAFAGLAP